MISGKERYESGAFARMITTKQRPRSGLKPKLFCQMGSSYPINIHQKSGHRLVSKSPQLSIGKIIK